MSLASAANELLKPQTPLQQLLEDINFQRTKEMRQLLKDDGGFVVLQGTTYWTDLFVRHFLFQSEPVHTIDSDDLLFFVRKKHVKSSARHMPKYETEVEVFRKDSRKLPIGDPDVDWEETVYLNMVIHQFDYTLTLAICTRTSPKELQVLRRHSQRVYASPSRRKMDTKGEGEEITYPHICFMVDNFDEVFSDILVRDGEMVCVELVANDKDGAVQGVIFLGSIRYDALKKVYDARQSSLSSKVAQRMSFGLFSSGAGVQTRCEFVRMKGPQGKGHAEMAVTKPKGSGVETPTSEPGFCATDMWDDWEEENDDYCTYRHQRRLSDPSANLNNFTRYSWRTKNAQDVTGGSTGAGAKARSENEGLDSLASEVSEIEAGNLRDDQRPAFSASVTKVHQNPNCETLIKLKAQSNDESGKILSIGGNDDGDGDEISVDGIGNRSPKDATVKSIIDDGNAEAECTVEAKEEDIVAVETVTTAKVEKAKNKNKKLSITSNKTTGCGGNCFGSKKCKRWTAVNLDTPEMSEVYCPSCEDASNATPACLNKMPEKQAKVKQRTILSVDSEMVVNSKQRISLRLSDKKGGSITRSASLGAADRRFVNKKPEQQKYRDRDQQQSKIKSIKNREKCKDHNNSKDMEREKKSNVTATTTNTLLSKVSPKHLRSKLSRNENKSKSDQKPSKNKLINTPNPNNNKTVSPPCSSSSSSTVPEEEAPIKPSEEYEIADDATSLNGGLECKCENSAKIAILSESESKLMISVRGKEELPVVEEHTQQPLSVTPEVQTNTHVKPYRIEKCSSVPVKSESHPLRLTLSAHNETIDNNIKSEDESNETTPMLFLNDLNGNLNKDSTLSPPTPSNPIQSISEGEDSNNAGDNNGHATLPRTAKRSAAQQAFYSKAINLVPKRTTKDGTNIYYWCDLPKRALKGVRILHLEYELDDGAYNPLWASRGFTQSFHFWKENRRQQSTPLNAFLTYVTLPWWSIAKDLLDHRETPILTF